MSEVVLSRKFVHVIPKTMHCLRKEWRRAAKSQFSVIQFRILAFLSRHPHSSCRELAEHIGISAPAASRLVETLVQKELIGRYPAPKDRRQILLKLRPLGTKRYKGVYASTTLRFSEIFESLSATQKKELSRNSPKHVWLTQLRVSRMKIHVIPELTPRP
jgi:DNA-binding MarR family transcriptional regulator